MHIKKIGSIFLATCFALALQAQDSLSISVDTLLQKISDNRIQYHTLNERTIITYDDGTVARQFNGSIRLKRDSVIWMSLSMFGFEGARVLITTDSFRLINKLENEYSVRGFSEVQNWLLFAVNYSMLQQIIAGEKINISSKASVAVKEDSSYVLYEENDQVMQTSWVNTENYTLQKILLKDKLLKQDMTITFEAYNYSNSKPFSNKRTIVINRGAETIKLLMDITRIVFNEELSYPFEVSEKHKRTE